MFSFTGIAEAVPSELLMSSLLFRHGLTARFARATKIAEKLFFNFLLSPAKEQRDESNGRKLKNTRPSGNSIACSFESVTHE